MYDIIRFAFFIFTLFPGTHKGEIEKIYKKILCNRAEVTPVSFYEIDIQDGTGRRRHVVSYYDTFLHGITESAFYQYDRLELLQLRPCSSEPLQPLDTLKYGVFPWISDTNYKSASQPHSTRERGKRGRLLAKLRRREGRPAVPSLVLENMQRLYDKTDGLYARIQTQKNFRDCSIHILRNLVKL